MRTMVLPLILLAGVLAGCVSTVAQKDDGTCVAQDFVHRVSAAGHCLVLDVYRSPNVGEGPMLIVFVHGDGLGNRGGRALAGMRRIFAEHVEGNLVMVALTRPGYSNGTATSSGDHYYHDGDAFREHTVNAVGHAILNLQDHYGAGRLVVIGHSGGANLLGLSMGRVAGFRPDLAILFAGSYDNERWANHRGFNKWYQGRGLDPIAHIADIDPASRIIALNGSEDTNTLSVFGADYVAALQAAGKNAVFREIAGEDHNTILKNRPMWEQLKAEIFVD